jgi:Bacterial TSP3 repeat
MRLPVPRLVLLACALLAVLPACASAKSSKGGTYPVVKSVSPLKLGVGDVMTITGKNFRKGKNKNTVVFKRDGGRAVFVKAPDATTTKIGVTVPAKLLPFLLKKKGKRTFTMFRVRVLSKRFAKSFTTKKKSPLIGPDAIGGGTADDCDGDKVKNKVDKDDDNDLIPDTLEATLGTNPCARDTDGDGESDGWEYYSALDRNGSAKPAPFAKPYPNPLDGKDADIDHDGDGLTDIQEYSAWATFGANKLPLSYSGGNPASAGRGAPPAGMAYMDRDRNGFLSDFERDADGDGIPNMDEGGSKDEARITKGQATDDSNYYDFGLFTLSYIKLAADQSKDPKPFCAGINQVPFYCLDSMDSHPITVDKVDTLDWLSADSDGDGIRDDQDDADHDDVPNITEYLTEIAAPFKDRKYRQLDACIPNADSRFCLLGSVDVDHDGIPNRDDTDDDGDGLSDATEQQYGLDPLRADTDNDGISDGFEFWSARDLNRLNNPYPGKAPYPNPLDGTDADLDFDSDGLTLKMEYQAWNYSGRPQPLNYSDGTRYTGGRVAADPAKDIDHNGWVSDDEKDVDNDGLSNWDETTGRMTIAWWSAEFAGTDPTIAVPFAGYHELPYPDAQRLFLQPSFVDPDSDGDGILDGNDDQDHDGYPNWFEVSRPDGSALYGGEHWVESYTSLLRYPTGTGTHTNPLARVQPFNPCKPIYSDNCHNHPPFGYYDQNDDWASDTTPDTPPPLMGTLPGTHA